MPKPSFRASQSRPIFSLAVCLLLSPSLWVTAAHAQASDQDVYTDSLQNGWQDYGWATLNYANTGPVHAGGDSISVQTSNYQALYLHHAAQDSTPYASLTFWINGGAAGGQPLQVQATLGGQAQAAYSLGAAPAGAWQKVTIGLDKLGVANNPNFDGFWIQSTSGASQPAFYVDDIALNAGTITTTPNAAVTVSVDANANRHAISPLVYGVCYGDASTLPDLNAPLNRLGGNNTSRYNWQINADNRANDYYYESIGDASATPGERGDTFFSTSKNAGAQALITIPMIDWIAKLGANRAKLGSFSVAKYGPQQSTDPYFADAGNGLHSDGTAVVGNDPNDADVPNSTGIQQAWVQHLVGKWGTAAGGGVKYYLLDNESSIWQGTHRDVHPNGPGMDEMLGKMLSYAAAIKAADPSALTVGPEEWGWSGYFYSGADQQASAGLGYDSSKYPDRKAHGGMDYIPYLLTQIHAHDQTTGTRALDVLSVHFYPQGGEGGNDTSAATELLRNRSTRQLWDPNYKSESWIGTQVMLIPRLKGWVSAYDPGLQTAITEYNWGAEGSINGATAQADILGIFGREGLDMATRWTTPAASTPTYKAMKLYRNYDGAKSGFGETSVSDTVPNPDNLSSFAAVRASDGALTVMVISKVLTGDTPVTLSLANFRAGSSAQAWQLTSANAITQIASVPVSGGGLTTTLPAQSVTLFVVPAAPVSRTVTGKVTLQSWAGTPQPLTFTLTPTGGTAGTVNPQTLTPAADGTFTLPGVPAGTYTLGVKGAKWLRKDVPLDTTGGPVSVPPMTLLGGDLDGDNVVGFSDFLILRNSYNATGTNLPADLDGDGTVGFSDFLILRNNFNAVGDN